MASLTSSGPNAGYVGQLLEQYLENPEAVDPAWRELFERGGVSVTSALPGLERLVEGARAQGDGDGGAAMAVAEPETRPDDVSAPAPAVERETAAAPDQELLGGIAAAMSLVKAYRTHGHLNARLDPLGSEPMGDPALDETRLQPPLTDELQARIPA
ncbi:MAG: 2-oxoglutarate dehydrogenase E1 subunit family protein, partial [Gaiellaceae bacterium]